MKIIVTLDPKMGKGTKTFIGDAFSSKFRIKNVLLGLFVGAIILGGTTIVFLMIVYIFRLIWNFTI